MCRKLEEAFHKRKYTNCQKPYGKRLNIISHQGNKKTNNKKTPL